MFADTGIAGIGNYKRALLPRQGVGKIRCIVYVRFERHESGLSRDMIGKRRQGDRSWAKSSEATTDRVWEMSGDQNAFLR